MKVEQRRLSPTGEWYNTSGEDLGQAAQLVLVFGSRENLERDHLFTTIQIQYPQAHLVLNSTSGEILDTVVSEDHLVVTAMAFDSTEIQVSQITFDEVETSAEAGKVLAQNLLRDDLSHVFVISDGQIVNGSNLAKGFNEYLPKGVLLTGGLAGDGTCFEKTLVGLNAVPAEGNIVAVGFYGDRLEVGFGSSGGWVPFGPVRRVTRAKANILYELDGQSALELYKKYLGDQAEGLPGSALRFPLCISTEEGRQLVRTILSIDESHQSMIFAGDIPMEARVRFMRASYEDLVDGAARAAEESQRGNAIEEADLAICVSCVGRKIVLGQHTEEETEMVREILGPSPAITGFYSYGELAPPEASDRCELHNQTMTITLIKEL